MSTVSLTRRAERMPFFLNDFFGKSFFDLFSPDTTLGRSNIPAVNITERPNDYLISVAAPGLEKKDFKISLEGNTVIISSEKEEKKEETTDKIARREFSYSSFERSFTLPEDVNMEKIDAIYKNGILDVILPKKENAKKGNISKQIEVN